VVAEGAPIPLTTLTMQSSRLQEQKISRICSFTEEIVKSSLIDATDYIGNEMRKKITKAIDVAFLNELTESTGTSVISSSGSTGSQFLADLNDALQALTLGANSRVYAIASQNMLTTIGLMTNTSGGLLFPGVGIGGGTACGVRFLPSNAANVSSAIVLVDAAQVAVGTVETTPLTLSVSTEADLQEDDAPDAGAQAMVSLFQTNKTAIRCSRYMGFKLLQDSGAAVIDGVATTI
jgi:HK97 family phage major capsid protein